MRLYRSYVRERRDKDEAYTRISYNQSQTITNVEEIQVVVSTKARKLTQKEINENRAERNMFNMALTLCSISILSRVLLIFLYICFFFFTSFSQSLILLIQLVYVYAFAPIVAVFIFYFFNKRFREKLSEKYSNKKSSNKIQTSTRGQS